MSDKQRNRIVQTIMQYPPDALQRLQEIDTYNALTGNVPLPVPGPRRELANRQEEIDTYNMLTGNVPLPVADPRRSMQRLIDDEVYGGPNSAPLTRNIDDEVYGYRGKR